jgi:hypothetical protein
MDGTRDREGADRADPRALAALVRSLVGVRDVRIDTDHDGRLAHVAIVPAAGATERQVRLNVISALMAGPGIALDPAALSIASSLPEPAGRGRPVPETTDTEPEPDAAMAPRRDADAGRRPGFAPHREGNGSGPGVLAVPDAGAAGAGPTHGRASTPGAGLDAWERLRLAGFALDPLEGGRLRCRVEVALAGAVRLAVREGPDGPGAAIDLAARAAVDAMRALGVPDGAPVQLDGVRVTDVAGRPHVIATILVWRGGANEARPGVAVAVTSYEEAAARAALEAGNAVPDGRPSSP